MCPGPCLYVTEHGAILILDGFPGSAPGGTDRRWDVIAEGFWEFAKTTVIAVAALFALLVVMLALPHSPFRRVFLRAAAWLLGAATLVSLVYVISPADLLPDVIPLLGQIDDLGALVGAVTTGIAAASAAIGSRKPVPPAADPREIVIEREEGGEEG